MRISDWSSDVCSSDLHAWTGGIFPVDGGKPRVVRRALFRLERGRRYYRQGAAFMAAVRIALIALALLAAVPAKTKSVDRLQPSIADNIGRASGRDRVCHYR